MPVYFTGEKQGNITEEIKKLRCSLLSLGMIST